MANKIEVRIDVRDKDKIGSLIKNGVFKTKDGKEIATKEMVFDLVEMKPESQKVVYDHEKYQLVKTHFAVKKQTKEDRDNGVETVFCGDGVSQIWKGDDEAPQNIKSAPKSAVEVENDDLPF
tara:strand:+ start:775 stop:1140 length:366 start_codon:yes stop_codon:yes gene_type:complete